MKRRLILAGVAGAAVIGSVAPSFASPVGVTVTKQDGGVYVATTFDGRPLVGAGNTDQGICVGVSLQVPQCVRPAIQGPPPPPTPAAHTRQALPIPNVVVYHDSTRTAVGVNDVGVVIYSDGQVCPVVSTQDWRCF